MYMSLAREGSPTMHPGPKSIFEALIAAGVTLVHTPAAQVPAVMHGSGVGAPASTGRAAPSLPVLPALPPLPPPSSWAVLPPCPPVPATPAVPAEPPGPTGVSFPAEPGA